MRPTKIFGTISNYLKTVFKPKNLKSLDFLRLEEKVLKQEDTIASFNSTLGVMARISSSQLNKQTKNEEIHAGVIDVLAQHEQEFDALRKLINQHADVINTMRKIVYKGNLPEESKKDLDEKPEINTFLDIKKKINKDN